jgi:ADP-ribose pyrophosphatase YjhB (NUDIX family)
MSLDTAQTQLADLIKTYKTLTEKEKFALARVFQTETGGKLSPFNSPSPVCVGVIEMTGPNGEMGYLGVRRAIPPFIGEVALAGGFLSTDEAPIAGVVREVLEETGLKLNPSQLDEMCLPKMAHNNNMLMFFNSTEVIPYSALVAANANLAEATDGEASELVFITPETPLCFPLHQEAVNAGFEARGIRPQAPVAKSFKI